MQRGETLKTARCLSLEPKELGFSLSYILGLTISGLWGIICLCFAELLVAEAEGTSNEAMRETDGRCWVL